MIAALRGTLVAQTAERVVVATAGGVSYEVAVPVGVLERLPATGSEVELRTVLVIRDDAWSLYGFDAEFDRAVFQRVLGATGVGPRLALALMSTLGAERLVQGLKQGETGILCTVPGVGKKTAERMILELKDRFGDLAIADGPPSVHGAAEQAITALVNLGYPSAEADRAVRAVLSRNGTDETADLIRRALQQLAGTR